MNNCKIIVKAKHSSSFLLHRYGRKKILFPCWAGLIVTTFSTSFVDNYWMFLAMRFVTGLFEGGAFLIIALLSVELVAPKHNGIVIAFVFISQSMASAMLGIQAWLIPNWKRLLQITSVPYLIGFIAYW